MARLDYWHVETLVAVVGRNNNPVGLSILGASALLEYVFPPFPGDTVTLFGSVLVLMHGWSLPLVFVALMTGSSVGAMIDYVLGVRLGQRYRAGKVIKSARMRGRVERVMQAFRRYGPMYVAVNRFLPGIRAVIFVAAGMAGLRAGWVLFYAIVSAMLWNALILLIGYLLGANWQEIQHFVGLYGRIVYAAIALVVLGAALRWLLRRNRGAPPGGG